MTKQAIIFDFNGTIFWDSEINFIAWDNCIRRWRGTPYSREEYHLLNGRTSLETLEALFGDLLQQEERVIRCAEKSTEYFKVLNKMKDSVSLAPGLEDLLSELVRRSVKLAIATSAPPQSMVEYEKIFSLSRFFDSKNIVPNDGTIKSKPAPDIFLHAIGTLGCRAEECVVFEDTESGILSAHRANVGKIIAVASNGADIETLQNMKEKAYIITDFSHIDINEILS
ncbi:MAG: HAD family phosphatase [Sphaerochaeta sp.]|nr:HAD family phosphatase [Sphaerochaeta sp.]